MKILELFAEEIWKDIDFTNGMYKASSKGRIRSTGKNGTRNKILKDLITKKGYSEVCMCGKRYKTHRIIAQVFIPNPNNLPQVNHIDGDKLNNCIDNLEWCTNEYNHKHKCEHGLNIVPENAGRPKKGVNKIDLSTNEILDTYGSIADAGRLNNLNPGNIRSVFIGKRNHCGGFGWSFTERVGE